MFPAFFQNLHGIPGLKAVATKGARLFRAWLYRRLPVWNRACFQKKLAGFERRWGLETRGFTKQGFFKIFRQKILASSQPKIFYELQAGDGRVGSLGIWLERENPSWRVEAWEHREFPAAAFARHRPSTQLHRDRKTSWANPGGETFPSGMTIRGSREASALCRALGRGAKGLKWVGIWNPGRHPAWFLRMRRLGFRLELVYERMEFYRKTK